MVCEIWRDKTGHIGQWVCQNLGFDIRELGDHLTYGFSDGKKMLGGLIFHNPLPHQHIWWTIYAPDKHWCTRRVLKHMFGLAFKELQCRRINILVSAGNAESLKFVQKLGFKKEGLLRKYRDNGEDCYFLGMLKEECPWL